MNWLATASDSGLEPLAYSNVAHVTKPGAYLQNSARAASYQLNAVGFWVNIRQVTLKAVAAEIWLCICGEPESGDSLISS